MKNTKKKDKSIILFLTWPAERDVNFKLHNPMNTTIEEEMESGKIQYFNINPKSGEKVVIVKSFDF